MLTVCIKPSLKKSCLSLLLMSALCTTVIAKQLTAENQLDREDIIVNTEVVWKAPSSSPNLLSQNQYTPLWHYKNNTYFVWVDASLRPWVTKIQNKVAESIPLDPNPDYKVVNDGHNKFSMGIDKKGFIHITGDMHNYTTQTTTTPYLKRYQKQSIMYWRSKLPEDINAGFDFVGGKDASTALPGTGFSYGRFFTNSKHDLYYSARVKAIFQSHTPGEMALGLYKYDPEAQNWKAIGGKAEDTRPGEYYDVLVWENAGMAPETWYQGFLSNLKFDTQDRLHLATAINSDINLSGNDKILYSFSNDGGENWQKLNGGQISHLPLRAVDDLSNQADVVDAVNSPRFFDSKTKVIGDVNGKPGVLNGSLYTWNGKNHGWKKFDDKFFLANTMDINKQGHLLMTASDLPTIMRAKSLDSMPYGHNIKGYQQYECVDEFALKKTGVLYGIGINTEENTQTILKTTFEKAPLPNEWKSLDIAASSPKYLSTSGYKDGKFVVTDYTTHIDHPNDSFHYIYKIMYGDGEIITQVNLEAPSTHSRAGLMMRESLSFNSRDVISLSVPNRNSAIFGYRKLTGGHTSNLWMPVQNDANWLKLQREGDVFKGYISSDGKEWTETGRVTMKLPKHLYVGLASASYHPYKMLRTTYDHVLAPTNSEINT